MKRAGFLRRIAGRTLHLFAPGYGCCGSCEMPWLFVESHSTSYTEFSGCFPLCEYCWRRMTVAERMPYYRELWLNWNQYGEIRDTQWLQIKAAVLAGK